MKHTMVTLVVVVLFALVPAAAEAMPASSPSPAKAQLGKAPDPDVQSLADLDLLPAAAPMPASPVAVVKVPTLNVRQGPDTGYPVLTTAAQNTPLSVLGQIHDCTWLNVKTPAGAGWAAGSAQYVTLNVGCATLPQVEIPKPVFHTSIGTVMLDESGFTNRWPLGCLNSDLWCKQAKAGYRIVYLYFIPVDGDAADLYDAWVSLSDNTPLLASNGNRTARWAAGFDHERLMLAFTPPSVDDNFKLCFPGEPCLAIGR